MVFYFVLLYCIKTMEACGRKKLCVPFTLLEFWSTLKLATLCSVTSCPIWVMMYSASLAARKDFPVPLGPERMIRRCSINRLRYLWIMGFGIRVSNTRLSMLFSFTPMMGMDGNVNTTFVGSRILHLSFWVKICKPGVETTLLVYLWGEP